MDQLVKLDGSKTYGENGKPGKGKKEGADFSSENLGVSCVSEKKLVEQV